MHLIRVSVHQCVVYTSGRWVMPALIYLRYPVLLSSQSSLSPVWAKWMTLPKLVSSWIVFLGQLATTLVKKLHFSKLEGCLMCALSSLRQKSLVEDRLKEANLIEGFSLIFHTKRSFRSFGTKPCMLSSNLHVVLDIRKLICVAFLPEVKLSPLRGSQLWHTWGFKVCACRSDSRGGALYHALESRL